MLIYLKRSCSIYRAPDKSGNYRKKNNINKSKGQTVILLIVTIPVILLIIFYTLSNGKLIYRKIKLQNASDGAAYTGALWQARGLNVISDLNWALVAAFSSEAVNPGSGFAVTKSVMLAQDMVNRTFPGTSAIASYGNFKSNFNNGNSIKLNLEGMFSLKVKRSLLLGVESYMVKDIERGWVNQRLDGPFTRTVGIGNPEPGFGGILNGFGIPAMTAFAQAMPDRDPRDLDSILSKNELSDLTGGLWDPSYYPKLIPVSAGFGAFKNGWLH